jgi:hypothetical protein
MAREQSDALIKIKRAAMTGRLIFSDKASVEMEADGLTELDVIESLVSAVAVYKKIRSRSTHRQRGEYLYIVQSTNLDGIFIYTKGKFVRRGELEYFYLLVSAKRSV